MQKIGGGGNLKHIALGVASACAAFALHGAWYDAPQIRATVDFGYSGNYAYFMNQSEDGRYLMLNTQSGNDNFPVLLFSTADLNGAVGNVPNCALGEAFGAKLYGTGGNGWKGGAISSTLGVMIPGSGAPTSGNAIYTALEMPSTRWAKNASAFEVTGLGTASIDGMDFNPSGTILYCNNKATQNKIVAYPVVSASAFGTPTEYTIAAATRIRNLSCHSVGGQDLVYFGEGAISKGATRSAYVFDPSTGSATVLVTDATRFATDIMNVKVSGAGTSAPKLYVQTESSGIYVYTLASDGKSVASMTPVREFLGATVSALCGASLCNVASFEVSGDGRFAYLVGLSTSGFAKPALCVIASDETSGAAVVAAKTLDGTETYAITANTVVNDLTVTAASTVTVAEGVTLTVKKIAGSAALTKSGAGELVMDAGCPTGNVVVAEGTLSVCGAGLPVALPDVASAAILHLDASDRDSIVFADGLTGNMRKVATWKDTRGSAYPHAIKSTRNGGQNPYLNESVFSDKPVMDFSTTAQWWGPAMDISSTLSVREAFFVVCDSTKCMPYINYDPNDGGLWQRNQWADSKLKNALVECDDTTTTYSTRLPAGFHVVHYRLTGNLAAYSIARQNNTFGGMQFGEIILFSSALSDADATAMKTYLARKWQIPVQFDTLTVAAGAAVAVAGARGLSVGALKTASAFETTVGAEPTEVASASVHFDASVESSFTYSGTTTDAGQRRISKWSDVRGAYYPTANPVDPTSDFKNAKLPFVNETSLAGTSVIDFGSDCSMNFSANVSVADAFFVVEETNQRPYVNQDTWNSTWKSWDAGPWQRNQWCDGNLSGGSVAVDGVASTYATYRATNGFHVVRITPKEAMTVNSIMRQGTGYGGARLAEVIIFGSAQTSDAASRLTAYLTSKWSQTAIWGAAQKAGAEVSVGNGATLKADVVSGVHGVTKEGSGDLRVGKTVTSQATNVRVREGAFSLAGVGEAVAVPSVVTSGAVLHLDASDADSIVFADDTTSGMKNVATWKDTRGGSYPTASRSTISTNAKNPYLNETLFSGKAVMDFTTTEQWSGPAMQFSTTLSVREAFFVVNDSAKTMPYLNDDSVGNNGNWQRNQWASGNVRSGLIEYDGDTAIAYNTRLPRGFHVVHYRLTGNLNVGSIASQNNTYGGMQIAEMILFSAAQSDENAASIKSYLARKWQRSDIQTLSFAKGATVAVADDMLVSATNAEQPTNGKVTLGENAKLILPSGITPGDVSVAGGTVSGNLALDDDFVCTVSGVDSPLTVSGTLTLPSVGTFNVGGSIALTELKEAFVIATATSVVAPDVSGWQVNASPIKYHYRVYVKGNQVLLEAERHGLQLLIR